MTHLIQYVFISMGLVKFTSIAVECSLYASVFLYSDYYNYIYIYMIINQLHVSKLQLLITSAYLFSSWVLNWSLKKLKKQFSQPTNTVVLNVVDLMKWMTSVIVIPVSGKALSCCTAMLVVCYDYETLVVG